MAIDEGRAGRLRAIRMERFEHGGEAADAMGVLHATYYGHENGSRGITADKGRKYADFYHVRFEWLMHGRGQKKPSNVHPIVELYDKIPSERQPEAERYLKYLAGNR